MGTHSIVVSYRNSTSNHNVPGPDLFSRHVVSYRNSTSNHNSRCNVVIGERLYLIEILHQTTTYLSIGSAGGLLYLIEILHQTTTLQLYHPEMRSCILSKFYIKPQPLKGMLSLSLVVSYRNSTSNHNERTS